MDLDSPVGTSPHLGHAIDGPPQALGPNARLFLFIGVIGGFTTFSAFGYETVALIEGGRLGAACLSVAANLGLGISAVWLGAATVRTLLLK